nr:ribonuclease H domain-containing protein [Tanacetum cinerariifolium]
MDIDDDTMLLLSEQRHELTAAIAADTDLDFAYNLQLQEAITASQTTTTQVPEPPSGIAHLLAAEIDSFNRDFNDRELAKNEMRKMHENVNMLLHDQLFAKEVMDVNEHEWRERGDLFEKPFKNGVGNGDEVFRVYCKGILSEESVGGIGRVRVGGIGVAICDTRDSCVFEVKKGVTVSAEDILELKSVIEGLSVAVSLGLRRVRVFCDTNAVYGYLTGKRRPTNNTTVTLVDQLNLIQRKFAYCGAYLVRQNDIMFAYKLARDAISSQNLLNVKNIMEVKAHRNRRGVEFSVGDKALVKLQLYRQITLGKRLSNNLAKRFYGPYETVEQIGKVAYRLALPSTSAIHPIFHVSILKLFTGRSPEEWLSDFQSAYPTYDLKDKVIVEVGKNVTPMDSRLGQGKRAKKVSGWQKEFMMG